MSTNATKIRPLIVMLASALVFGFAATSAFALTAKQKSANMDACMAAMGGFSIGAFKACCIGAGGTFQYYKHADGVIVLECKFSDDKTVTSTGFSSVAALGGSRLTAATDATTTATISPLAPAQTSALSVTG